MSADFDRDQLLDIFVAEAGDDMERFWKALHLEGKARPEPADVADFHAIGHKLKGAALLYGFPGLGQLGALLEETLEHVQEISPEQWPVAFDVIRDIVASFRHQVARIGRGEGEDASLVDGFVQRCAQFLPAASPETGSTQSPNTSTEPPDEYLLPVMDEEVLSYFAPEAEDYLNTIHTLLQRLDIDVSDVETIHQLYRVAHTLKGSAYTVGFQVVGDVALPIENCLIAVREGTAVITPQWIATIRHAVDVMRSLMARDAQQLARLRQDVPCIMTMLRELEHGISQAEDSATASVPDTRASVREVAPPAVVAAEPIAQAAEHNHSLQLSEAYLIPQLDAEVISYFAPEAQEYLDNLETDLLRVDKDAANPDIIHQLFRTAHTLKGSAYTVGFQSIGDLTHHIEDFMGAVREGRVTFLLGHTDVLLRAIDVIRALMRRDPSVFSRTRQRFAASLQELKGLGEASPTGGMDSAVPSVPEAVVPSDLNEAETAESINAGEGKSGEEREVIRVSRDRLERLLNLVGELVIDRGRLEQRLRTLEQLATQVLANKNRLTDAVRTFEDKHTFSFQPSPLSQGESAPQAFPGVSDFGSLEFDKYDDFNILARRISEVTADISESMSQLSGSIRRAQDDMGSLQQLTLGMRDEIARARMVPIGTPFTRFRRAAREMARATGKEVNLVTSGEHTEIDTGVVERLVDPLVHLVRNAVYHGIEPASIRRVQGKPEAGTVYLHAAHRGNSVLIEVEDDGAGLDIAKIKAKAVKLGLVRQDVAETLPESEVIKFIFLPGFSTADAIGEQAGRGVGMDVVKRVIETMNGHIEVESVRGQGTKFTMHLPLTLLIATALLVRVGKERYAIPLPSVREVTMSTASTIQHMGDRRVVQIGDEAIEIYPLGSLIRREAGMTDDASPVVIVRTSTGALGCAVDELLGRQEIVIKSLGGLKPYERSVFGGATIDPEGRVVLVLDVSRLTTREYYESVSIAQAPAVPSNEDATGNRDARQDSRSPLPLLLIDDSLSIRKFVGRMLEAAGYIVETATDGEEGCRKAMVQAYQLIITDLEMPKLNGYEVIQALRARPQTHATPILVMTTRAGEKHRQMAVSVGASGYIAKPVEERALIQEVRKWTAPGARAEI